MGTGYCGKSVWVSRLCGLGVYIDVPFDGLPGGGFGEDDVVEGCSSDGHGYGGEKVSCTSACVLKKQVQRVSKREGETFTSYC